MSKAIFIWVSRHKLTTSQRTALETLGFDKIIEAGDCDAFDKEALLAHVGLRISSFRHPLDTVVVGVVNPAAALHLHNAGYRVAVAHNINRAPEGERPSFEFHEWVIF